MVYHHPLLPFEKQQVSTAQVVVAVANAVIRRVLQKFQNFRNDAGGAHN